MTFSPNFKPERIVDKVRNHMRRRNRKASEDRIMRDVRKEDRYCRFPLCGCGKLKLTLDVAHAGADGHRGSGGNPDGSRTTPENLILVCRPRHRAHKFSIDKKTLRVEPLTERGLRGPVRWLIDMSHLPTDVQWVEIARETSPHHFEPFTEAQAEILRYLAGMEC